MSATTVASLEATAREAQAKIEEASAAHGELFTAAQKLASETGAKDAAPGSDALKEIDDAFRAADEKKEELAQAQAQLNATLIETVTAMSGEMRSLASGGSGSGDARSFGERAVNSEQYLAALDDGRIEAHDGGLPKIEVASSSETKTFLASTDGGALIDPDRPAGILDLIQRRIRLLDLMTITTTDSSSVEEIVQQTRNNQAAEIAHATPGATTVAATGVPTPESDYIWTRVTHNVRRIGHHSIQPRSMMADAGRLEGLVNGELANGIRLRTEAQALSGDGVGENWRGIRNTAGISTAAIGVDTLPDAVHKQMTAVRVALEDDISAVGMHPSVYEKYVLAKDANGNYLNHRGTQESMPVTTWGYPTVISTVFPTTEVLVGNFSWATVYVREGIDIRSGFINSQMIEDLVTINAEYRGAFGVRRPQAFGTVTGIV